MWRDAHDAYLESRILSADSLELVRLLYQGCTAAVKDARRHLAASQIAERSRAITKAWDILTELSNALDHSRGGDLSVRLAQLYDYMRRRLLEANMQQADAPLAEVLGLLATLSEAWEGARRDAPERAAAASPWGPPPPAEAVASGVSQAWSF
ncbi:MAG TPA: flagellar export chaperone FliS [Bryobacteraceae bacterium]|jgi:flagellar protein FliS